MASISMSKSIHHSSELVVLWLAPLASRSILDLHEGNIKKLFHETVKIVILWSQHRKKDREIILYSGYEISWFDAEGQVRGHLNLWIIK